ncbi:MAG: preprotein translocase subunit SecA [Spirochaetales bacterium]|uniref:Protein translocase subunit SecA n=1 Tax=Candidatus Thalassospirochaeta sargassi TaxID=3119039 RepID=A0AAJ1MKI1_9SPIO|nr:preprotein translocase subunit SecA [Spirochaetales bacterium]
MLKKIITSVVGSKHERDLKELLPILHKINEKETWAMAVADEDFPAKTDEFKSRIKSGETLDSLLPEAYALAREAARRTLGERAYDVQLLGGIVLHQGKIMEMKTGEGKTLSSVSAAYLNALSGKGVHVVTVNDYLAERDAEWMKPVYAMLGLTVGSILSNMDPETRKKSYACDITYGTNNEFGFDYLRDNMKWGASDRVQRPHNYCIIDEIDSILIDEARTPLIISGAADDDTSKFNQVNALVGRLKECSKDPETGDYPEEELEGDFKLDEKSKKVTFTEEGNNTIEQILLKTGAIKDSLYSDENFEYIHYFTQAVRAHHLYTKDVDYVIEDRQVQIVDEFTGRILHGRRYSDGLHQAIEAKEGIKVARRNRTLATITFQNYFRMYEKISGMTGTADTEAKEFGSIYGLDVVVVPTNRPVMRFDDDDVIYFNESLKLNAICDEIARVHEKGQPILVGTVSIEKSEKISKLLVKRGVRHEVLNAKNHSREAMIIAEAGAEGSVTIATNMAGRGTDIKLGGNPEFRARKKVGTDASDADFKKAYAVEYEKWKKDYERVKDLGGLYILGTERHESRRIDNQLRGRSGRQGDPGESRFFLSLDDDLMRLFARDSLRSIMGRAGMEDGEPLYHPLINRAIERAQTRVEERNFEIRKHLLDFDDVLNEQRKFIYAQRDDITQTADLTPRIIDSADEMAEEMLDRYREEGSKDSRAAFNQLLEDLKLNFFFEPESAEEFSELPFDGKKEAILKYIHDDINGKVALLGAENFNQFIRFEYLKRIDTKWQEHLEQLEALREAVYLRSYAQKNPLLEYKLEGFDIFDRLIVDIKSNIAQKVIKVKIRKTDQPIRRQGPATSIQERHSAIGAFSAGGASAPAVNAERPEARGGAGVQVKRAAPKVGRNDPCPCGSGKKYKHCCGA